jgi:hypothetical protein
MRMLYSAMRRVFTVTVIKGVNRTGIFGGSNF